MMVNVIPTVFEPVINIVSNKMMAMPRMMTKKMTMIMMMRIHTRR